MRFKPAPRSDRPMRTPRALRRTRRTRLRTGAQRLSRPAMATARRLASLLLFALLNLRPQLLRAGRLLFEVGDAFVDDRAELLFLYLSAQRA